MAHVQATTRIGEHGQCVVFGAGYIQVLGLMRQVVKRDSWKKFPYVEGEVRASVCECERVSE